MAILAYRGDEQRRPVFSATTARCEGEGIHTILPHPQHHAPRAGADNQRQQTALDRASRQRATQAAPPIKIQSAAR